MRDDVIIRKIQPSEKAIINHTAEIHLETFTGFFLTFMGRGFLRQMYMCYTTHPGSGLLIAFKEDEPIGFLAYSCDMSGLYKHMLKTKLIPFAWYSLCALFRKPKTFTRLFRAFLKQGEAKRAEAYIELASIGVKPAEKARGVATELINQLKTMIDFEQFAYISLETDAVNNDAANLFYLKNGFKMFRAYETPEGRKMNEYRWKKEKKQEDLLK